MPMPMMKHAPKLALLLAALVVDDAAAVTTRAFNTRTYKEFDEGEAEQVLISSRGELSSGIATDRVELETDALWTAARAADGTIYVGGVADGAVYAVAGGKVKKVLSLEEETPWIGALLVGPDGTLYVGTLASGRVHMLAKGAEKATLLADFGGATDAAVVDAGTKDKPKADAKDKDKPKADAKDKDKADAKDKDKADAKDKDKADANIDATDADAAHVWAMSLDAAGKTLFAATGPNGKLYAIDLGTKKARVIWDSEEEHLLALHRAKDGALWLGTSDEAILYRFDVQRGEARAIADFSGTEVKAIAELDGAFIVAANEFEPKSGVPSPRPQKGPKGTAPKAPEAGSGPGADRGAEPSRSGERKGTGALFRVEPDGRVEQLHALAEGYFQSLAATADGVYAASAAGGKLYLVRADRTVATAFDVDERQVNAVLAWDDKVAFATGDGGAVYLSRGPAADATYTSKVLDALFAARWGRLRWRGTAGVTVETRSGNTARPGVGWSGWRKLGGVARSSGDSHRGEVDSPPARYLQYRIQLSGAERVHEVTTYYLPQNQRARVIDVTLGEGDPATRPPVTIAPGPQKARTPVVKLTWKVENLDGDELRYTLATRADGAGEWLPVPTGTEPLTKAEFEWNTEALPDGFYRLRVTASDTRANPRDLALEGPLVTPAFLIDNQKPALASVEVRYPLVSGRATDSFSRVDELAWSLDGGEYTMIFPKDGIFDDLSEAFSVELPTGLAPGPHTLSLRVADEADNIGALSVAFRVGK